MSTTPNPLTPNLSSRPEAAGRSGETPVFAPAHASGAPHPPAARTFQPWIILRKDLLHIWPELLVSLGLLVGFAAVRSIATDGAQSPDVTTEIYALLAGVLRFLIPISWLVLISRLVHDEELVGDRQFWITRPYTWYFLLLAKVVFVIVFLGIPFALMQAWMLHHAGLYPLYSLHGMAGAIGTLAMICILPFFAIAAVTMTFVRYISSVLAGFLYALIVMVIAFWQFPDRLQAPGIDWVLTTLVVLLPLAAILVQYARRRTAIARTLLLVTPLVFLLAGAITPVTGLINHAFAASNSLGPLTFDPDPNRQQPDGRLFVFGHKVSLNIPVAFQLTGLSDDAFLEAAYVRATIDAPGTHFDSGWMALNQRLRAANPGPDLTFHIPQSVLAGLHNQPVHLHLDIAARAWKPGTPWTVPATERPFALPGRANCILDPADGSLDCRHAYRAEGVTLVSATVHSGNCLEPGPQAAQAEAVLPPDSGLFDPVALSPVHLTFGQRAAAELCAGTPVTFTPYVQAATGQLHLDIPQIQLDAYATHLQVQNEAR